MTGTWYPPTAGSGQFLCNPPFAMTFPIATTTTARIDACNPCSERRNRAMQLLGITEASDKPITYAHLLDVLGLDDALWCCRAEPDLAPLWRRYAVWCAQQVQHLMIDSRSVVALDVAERHAAGQASDEELRAARSAAESAARSAARSAQAAAFRQLITTGDLPALRPDLEGAA